MTAPNVTFTAIFNAAGAARVIRQLQAGLVALHRQQVANNQLTRSAIGDTARLASNVTRLVLAWQGIRGTFGLIGEGLKFNRVIETSRLGIAALITAEARLRDEHGRLLEGTEALAAAQGLAEGQLTKLRIAGIRTAATTEELVTAFQEAVGAGVSVGLTLDQIRTFTVQVAQAASTINLPFNQLNQEVRSILQGTIDRNSRIAKALQLTNAQVNQAKQQNRLAELLNEKFQAFSIAGEEVVKTWAALGSNIKDAIQLLSGEATKTFFTQIRDAGLAALGEIFDLDRAEIRESFRGLVEGFRVVFGEAGALFSEMIESAVRGARSLSEWLDRNKVAVQETVTAFGTLVRETAGLLADIIQVATGFAGSEVASGKMADHIRVATGFVRLLRDHIETIVGMLKLMIAGQLISAAITHPVATAIAGVIVLLGYLNRLKGASQTARDEFNRQTDAFSRNLAESIRLGEQYITLARQIEQGKLKGQELKDAYTELASIQDRLIRSDDRYREAFKKSGQTADQVAKAIRGVTQAQLDGLNQNIKALEAQERKALEVLASLGASDTGDVSPLAGESASAFKKRQEQAALMQRELAGIRGNLDSVRNAARFAFTEIDRAERELRQVTLEAREGANKARQEAALKDAIDAAKAAVKTAKAQADAEAEIQKSLFENNTISAVDYYEKLKDLQQTAFDAELRLAQLELQLAQLRNDPGDIAKAKEHAEQVEAARAEVINRFTREEFAAVKEFAKQRREIETEAMTFGDADDQLIARVRRITEQYRDALQKAFANKDFKAVMEINRIIDLKTAGEQFNQIQEMSSRAAQRMQDDVKLIQINLESGAISQAEAQRELANVYTSNANKVAAFIEQLEKLRPLLGSNPEFLDFLDQMGVQLVQLQHDAAVAGDGLFALKAGFRSAVEEGLGTFLEDFGKDSKTAGQLFKEFANSVINDMRRIVAQAIASRIVQTLFKGFGSSGGSAVGNVTQSGGKFAGGLAGAPRRATGGGLIEGPGTPTSDSIPLIWVSRKEYVEPAHVVDYYGSRWFEFQRQKKLSKSVVQAILSGQTGANVISRQGFRNRFAQGGAVGIASSARESFRQSQQVNVTTDLRLAFDENGALRVWQGKTGRKIVLGHVASNRRAVDRVLTKTLKH